MENKIKTPKQKIVVIYHGKCRDGFGGAWAAWRKFKNKAAYLPAFDRFAPPCELKNKKIYLIDYTYRPETIRALLAAGNSVTAIDHHVSARGAVKMTEKYLFALDHSGSVLAWKYFHPGKKVPALLKYIEDGDLWKWKVPHSKEILAYIHLLGLEFNLWNRIEKDLEDKRRRKVFIEKGDILMQYEMNIFRELLNYAEPVSFLGHKVFAVNASHHFSSHLGEALAKRTGLFAIVWSERSGEIKVSLRSTEGGTDVSKIAQKFKGGGHRDAAGFSFAAGKKFPWKRIKPRN